MLDEDMSDNDSFPSYEKCPEPYWEAEKDDAIALQLDPN
jgi:hypothetical protein